MKKTKEVTRIDKQVESVLCNKCGMECYDISLYKETDGETFFVYGRPKGLDYDFCTFELCTTCIVKLIYSFKIPPEYEQ